MIESMEIIHYKIIIELLIIFRDKWKTRDSTTESDSSNVFSTFVFEFPIFSIIPRSHQKERGIQYQSQEKEETGAYLVKKKES